MNLNVALWAGGLLLAAALVAWIRRLLRPRTLDDDFFGTMTFDSFFRWSARRRVEAADREVEMNLGGEKEEPPGERQRAFLGELEERYPKLLDSLFPSLSRAAAAVAGERRRSPGDFELRALDVPDTAEEDEVWSMTFRSKDDALDVEVEMQGWNARELDATPIDDRDEEVREPVPEHRMGDDRAAVAERGVVRLPEPPYSPVLSRGAILVSNVLGFVPLLCLILPPLVIVLWLGDAAEGSWSEMMEAITPVQRAGLYTCASLMLYALFSTAFDLSGSPNRYLERTARRILGRRRDRLVDPNARKAHFVEVVPRANWTRQMLETATDVGFVRVDVDRGLVLFEGGNERWAVRGADIVSCQFEKLRTGHIAHYFVVFELRNAALGTKERCVASRHGGKAFLGHAGRKWAEALVASVDRIRPGR